MAEEATRLGLAEAERLITRALEANGVSPANARSTAAALVAAEADGQGGHGLMRTPGYAEQARVGKVDGQATPQVAAVSAAALRIDAGRGFAYPAADLAIERLPPLVRGAGVAAAGIFASHHFGQAGRHVERLADAGLVALAFANTPRAMPFHGGVAARMGTNPIAFAAPVSGRPPLVIDMALSVVARGRIASAEQRGETIPPDWAVDSEGRPTTDPAMALAGALLPVGGAKGAALALMVEILCGALTGSSFGWQASGFLDAKGAPPRTGQFLLAFDPAFFAGEGFDARMRDLVETVAGDGARLPGDRRLAARHRAETEGLAVPAALHDRIVALGEGALA